MDVQVSLGKLLSKVQKMVSNAAKAGVYIQTSRRDIWYDRLRWGERERERETYG